MEYLREQSPHPDQPSASERPDHPVPPYPHQINTPGGTRSPYPRDAGDSHRHKKPPHQHVGGARLASYFLVSTVCNILLAFYALYAYAQCVELSNDILASGQHATLAETIFQALLLLSPFFLTVLINRLLYRVMRGRHRRFARWTGPAACIFVVVVQVAFIWLLLQSAGSGPTGGFNLDTISTLLPSG